jgi:methylase of polypeptide subunit release factors
VRILDLFSGAGGAAVGYHRAFPDAEIVGVDINPQPRYPFTFIQADAMTFPLDGYDFIHASCPDCVDGRVSWERLVKVFVAVHDNPTPLDREGISAASLLVYLRGIR